MRRSEAVQSEATCGRIRRTASHTVGVVVVGICAALTACQRGAPAGISLSDPCGTPVSSGAVVRVTANQPIGRIRRFRDLSAVTEPFSLGVEADSGLFIAVMPDSVLRVARRVSTWGPDSSQIGGVDAITLRDDGTVVVVDRSSQRIVSFDRDGRVTAVIPLRPGSMAEGYAAGGGEVVAISSRPAEKAFATTIGELYKLDSLGRFGLSIAQFPSLARHLTSAPSSSTLLPRPLERQPIVRWSPRVGWMIGSTDSLTLSFSADARRAPVVAAGRRAPIEAGARDSSIEAYVRFSGAQGALAMKLREFASKELFTHRAQLQLVDEILPLSDVRIAVRRMYLCSDRQGWNIVESPGHPARDFTVPLTFVPVAADATGALFSERQGDTLFVRHISLPSR